MANYLQSPNIQFSSYTPAIDPNLYGRVGMYKQQQYDEGVRKVQSYIDSVAGIDVIKPEHKNYLQTKMNDITSKVKTIAGSDFSNQQVVGQIGGLTAKIAKDPIIQNAMIATQVDKQQRAILEKDRESGKYSINNEQDYLDQRNAWLNDGKVDSAFNGRYTPYTDVRKKALDIFKTIDPSIQEQDFIIGADGKVNFSGDVIQRAKTKGIAPQTIQAALQAGLDANDFNQLALDGRQTFKGADAFRLAELTNQTYADNKTSLQSKLDVLKDRQKNVGTGYEANELEQKILSVERALKDNDRRSVQTAQLIADGNLAAVRSQVYTNNFLDQFSNAFSYTEVSNSYENNPFFNVRMEKANLELKAREAAQKLGTGGAGGFVIDAARQEELTNVNPQVFTENIQIERSKLNEAKNSVLNAEGHPGDEAWLEQQRILYNTGKKGNISNKLAGYFELEENKEKEILTNENIIKNVTEQVEAETGSIYKFIPKDAKPIAFRVGDETYQFTPQELVDFNAKQNKLKEIRVDRAFMGADKAVGFEKQQAAQMEQKMTNEVFNSMTDKEKALYKTISSSNTRKNVPNVVKQVEYINKAVNEKEKEFLQERSNKINEELANRTMESRRISYPIPAGKTELVDAIRNKTGNVLDVIEQTGGNVGTDTRGFDLPKAREMYLDPKTTYSLVTKPQTAFGESKYWLKMNRGEGETQEMPLTVEQKRAIFGNAYEQSVPKVEQAINLTGTGSTNFAGTADINKALVNPYLTQTDFPKVTQYSIKGDIENVYGQYNPVFYIWDPKNQKHVKKEIKNPGGLLFTEESLQDLLQNGITDDYIYQLLYTDVETTPTPEDKKEIQTINNKAF